LFSLLLLCSINLSAQQHGIDPLPPPQPDTIVNEPGHVTRLSLFKPALQEEITLGRSKTLILSLDPAYTYLHIQSQPNLAFNFYVVPAFTVQSRFYSNLERRKFRNRVTDDYSGAYVGITA
jgi:hypothetical protein